VRQTRHVRHHVKVKVPRVRHVEVREALQTDEEALLGGGPRGEAVEVEVRQAGQVRPGYVGWRLYQVLAREEVQKDRHDQLPRR
jgi:hypothetical protein